mmetsp:Transcript_20026/g.30032  ORF Transcript_20026/g.30032 Transcript_20026/m.30032 type:complete len:1057 (+) Transcript_20026:205-3375(+)
MTIKEVMIENRSTANCNSNYNSINTNTVQTNCKRNNALRNTSRKRLLLSTISVYFIITSSSPSSLPLSTCSSTLVQAATTPNQGFITIPKSSFGQLQHRSSRQTEPTQTQTPVRPNVFRPHLLNHQSSQTQTRPLLKNVLYSTVQKQKESDEKRTNQRKRRRRKKQHHLNNLNNNKKKKSKTYKEIKQERRELKIMRDVVESGSGPGHVSRSGSQSEMKHRDQRKVNDSSSSSSRKSISSNDISSSSSSSSSSTTTNKSTHQQPQQHDSHDVRQRMMNNNIKIIQPPSRTKEEAERSSNRISKAHQLLDDLTNTGGITADDEDPSLFVGGTTSSSNYHSSSRSSKTSAFTSSKSTATTTSPSSSDTTKSKSIDDDTYSETTKTVPDTYWYNGNLQKGKGDYVTRWARGMKVAEPIRKYDPVAAEKLLFNQPTKWLVRNIQIGLPLATWAVGVIYDISTDREEENRKNRARQLLATISGLGPAIIKGGQALASRSDLMPSEYLEELQKLQDDVPRFENELAFDTVEEELGVEFDSVFELIGTDPVAAASIGQVYKARLRGNGDIVALKIQRPKCEEVIALDLYVLRWWSGVANILTTLLNRDIDVQNIIDDFGELIYRELDYVAEAANAQRFSELYANQVKDVFVPKVYSELTTSKVLTMEWVEGFRLTDNESLEKYGLDRKKLVDTLVQCSLRQILGNGFFHADPHAGNLLVVPDGRLCYLDFGMMSYAGASQRNGFILAVVHIVNRDWDELVSMYQRLGFIPEGTNLKPIAIALEKSLPDALNSDISELNFKNVVGKLGDIMYTYPFSLPPFYISIIRCLGVLEGLAIQVDPQARIISEAYPYVASRVLTDTQGELQEALRRLALTSDGKVRWNRLERLLSEARESQGYDVSVAVSSLTDYLISDDGEQLLNDFADQIVEGVDNLSTETISYIVEAVRALAIKDEVAAVKAFRTLETILQAGEGNNQEILREHLSNVLPDPTPSMRQFGRITTLLGARGSRSDPSKLIPIVRRLSQEPKIQRVASEILARLGELMLSRSLRTVFGLPPKERKNST